MSNIRFLETLHHDLLYAMRTFRKNPLFGVTAVLTLALAIGGNTAMFTVIRAVLLKPLEYREPDRLVRITGGATQARFAEMRIAALSFIEIGALPARKTSPLLAQQKRRSCGPPASRPVSSEFWASIRYWDAAFFPRRFARRRACCNDQRRALAAPVPGRSANRRQDHHSVGRALHHHRSSAGALPVPFSKNGRLDDSAIGLAGGTAQVSTAKPFLDYLRPSEAGAEPGAS